MDSLFIGRRKEQTSVTKSLLETGGSSNDSVTPLHEKAVDGVIILLLEKPVNFFETLISRAFAFLLSFCVWSNDIVTTL